MIALRRPFETAITVGFRVGLTGRLISCLSNRRCAQLYANAQLDALTGSGCQRVGVFGVLVMGIRVFDVLPATCNDPEMRQRGVAMSVTKS
jgi:hypothetical protein